MNYRNELTCRPLQGRGKHLPWIPRQRQSGLCPTELPPHTPGPTSRRQMKRWVVKARGGEE